MAVPPPALPARVAAVGPDTTDPSIAAALEAALADLPSDFDPEAYVPPARVARLLAASDESLPALVQRVDMATGFRMTAAAKRPRCLGHRGVAALYPENTMASFQAALAAGADGIELDIRMTKDHEIVVLHDTTLDRTTTGKGNVTDRTWDEVKQLRAVKTHLGYKDCFAKHGCDLVVPDAHPEAGPTTAPIPRLVEVMDMLLAHPRQDATMIIDIKWDNPIDIMTHLRTLLERPQYASLLPRITLGIWSPHYLFALPPRSLPVKRSFIGNSLALAQLFYGSVDNFSIDKDVVAANAAWVHRRQAAGYTVSVWTVDTDADLDAVMAVGVDDVISDCVGKCVRARDAANKDAVGAPAVPIKVVTVGPGARAVA
ncbi:hypothetical protein GGF32_004403 [Allomyces javanicus]|nr:hypothetical protein GGF32_004403 [Allomyces javanicus]